MVYCMTPSSFISQILTGNVEERNEVILMNGRYKPSVTVSNGFYGGVVWRT